MRVDFCFASNIDLLFFGRTLAGLYAQRDLTVRLRMVDWITNSFCAAVEFENFKLALELSDHSDLWERDLLDWCDVYAKRNIGLDCAAPQAQKIIPFGLNWACHSRRSVIATLTSIAVTFQYASKTRLREIYRYLASPHWKDFEHDPWQPVENTLLFQTRVWEPREALGDELVNEQRVGLLRALRSEFGHRAVGGVVPTPFARRYCPDLITSQPCRQSQYVRWAKKPLIGIYFRGLFGSIAFKMAEYLAASKCIVSDPVNNQLTKSLDHILTYRSNDQCLAACDRIFSDPSLAQDHRHNSWNYYLAEARPGAHFANLLERARLRATANRRLEPAACPESGRSIDSAAIPV